MNGKCEIFDADAFNRNKLCHFKHEKVKNNEISDISLGNFVINEIKII